MTRAELQTLSGEQGLTDAEIAQRYNVSTNQVYRRRQQMNLIHGQRTAQQLAQIVRLSETIKRLPDAAIAEIEAIVQRYAGHSGVH